MPNTSNIWWGTAGGCTARHAHVGDAPNIRLPAQIPEERHVTCGRHGPPFRSAYWAYTRWLDDDILIESFGELFAVLLHRAIEHHPADLPSTPGPVGQQQAVHNSETKRIPISWGDVTSSQEKSPP